jgi:2-oxoglutarate dehydrogenase E1 component
MDKFSFLSNTDVSSIEDIYQNFLSNPDSVDESWKNFFKGFEFARANYEEGNREIPEQVKKEFSVITLINAYRERGHYFTKTNPVRERRQYHPTLDIENFGLTNLDLESEFEAGIEVGLGKAKLKNIIELLKQTYCQSIGVEFMHIRDVEQREWLKKKMESSRNTPKFAIDEKKTILNKLNQAVVFENFLHTKFVGQKRFSLEGAETMIPALDTVIETAADLGAEDFVLGMAHRGRLNVLANILNKTYKDIFTEFEGKGAEDSLFDGDVKYHLGYSSDQKTNSGKSIHLSLTPNPSHLEAVNPVVEGIARAKIDKVHQGDESKVVPILIHGDAAIAAQGIVYEVVQMSLLKGYRTGGTVHFVINNQVGFTTNYLDARSSIYCTDVAKIVLSPIFHVNGDDVESLVFVCQLAMEYRQKYHQDVFIDLLCYRKHGHNEGDEPRFTQPTLYKTIAKHPNPREIYNNKLIAEGTIESTLAKTMEEDFKSLLQQMLDKSKQQEKAKITSFLEGPWTGIKMATAEDIFKDYKTAVSEKKFNELAAQIVKLPEDKKFFNKTAKLFNDRAVMIENDKYDWAMGELMAYTTLLDEGFPIRFSGQDVERGTFSHRHAVVKVEDSEETYIPINNIKDQKAQLQIYNSLLSEYGVLGFEFGYSLAAPKTLTIWEAQFGDFFNGAQIMIDQFITCSESKWRRMNGLVMLLPHGYEGMGPEHSSARMERFLQMCADNNMQILNCTTPANFFHAIRRQIHRPFRKPLVVFTPKSLLRHPKCTSSLQDFTKTNFQELIDDATAKSAEVKKVVFCTGKIYYDLLKQKEELNDKSTAIVRLEQVYPLPLNQILEVKAKYAKAKDFIWAQEEPENMGAWAFIFRKLVGHFNNLRLASRPESASPATGYSKIHNEQQDAIVNSIFNS